MTCNPSVTCVRLRPESKRPTQKPNPKARVKARSELRGAELVADTPAFETNHEQTLYVRYVFRNYLISGQRDPVSAWPVCQAVRLAAVGYRRVFRPRPWARRAGGSRAPVLWQDF